MLEHFFHHFLKLLKIDLSVAINIDLLDNLFPNFFTQILATSQNLFDFIKVNGSTLIFVKVIESLPQLITLQEKLSIGSCCHKLGKVDLLTVICVNQFKNSIDCGFGIIFAVIFGVTLENLIILQLTVFVYIQLRKYLLKPGSFLFGHHEVDHHAQSSLLHFACG